MPRTDKLYRVPAVTRSNLLSPGPQVLVPVVTVANHVRTTRVPYLVFLNLVASSCDTLLLQEPSFTRNLTYLDSPTTISSYFQRKGNFGLTLLRRLGRTPRADASSNGAVAGELNMCADLDLETERTLRRVRQVRRRIEFENSLHSQTENLTAKETSIHSSLSDSESEKFFSPSHAGTLQMAEPPRVTLRQMGGASVGLENQLVRYP
ncbi:hypothetical protein PIB30_031208 [Stylosanthes scabra]|uniref:Uncharacterized protein n=1 Tax=Stylosanthes scabra TaxID=79078 RepID=A0ABU6SBT7_9FABA|nr:hypothetical protein [Stylosanthes scabra]